MDHSDNPHSPVSIGAVDATDAASERTGWGAAALAGLGALLLTSCCILPLALVSVGVGGVFIAQLGALYAYKWLTFTFAAAALAFGFRRAYRPRPLRGRNLRSCGGSTADAGRSVGRRRRHRAGDDLSRPRPAVFPLLIRQETDPCRYAPLPLPVSLPSPPSLSRPPRNRSAPRLTVSGLTCPSCSVIAGRSIDALEGAEVLGFEAGKGSTGTFAVIYDDALLAPAAIEAAIEANGYDAALAGSAS